MNASALLIVRRCDSEFLNVCCSNCVAMHTDSGLHRSDIATHSLLGGQHGEESEEGKDREEKEEEVQEEVTSRIERRDRRSAESSVAKAGEAEQQRAPMLLQVATPALVDDGGRRRNEDHPLYLEGQARTDPVRDAFDAFASKVILPAEIIEFSADAPGP